MENKKAVVPKLRFPEFGGEWEFQFLDSLLDFKNGINASKEMYGSGYRFINVLDIIENDFITHDKIKGQVIVTKDVFNKNIVEYGDILFQRSSETREEVGQSNVYLDENMPATFGGFVIRGKKIGDYFPVFFHLLLKSSMARKEITSKSGGSTRYNIGQDILSSISLPFPSLQEQQKIASFLNQVDRKINLLTSKVSALEAYRKGVMQQLFSQEVRFKNSNGNDFPMWEKKKLGEIYDVVVGGTPSTTKKEYWGGNIGWLSSGDLGNGIVEKPSKFITEKGFQNSSAKLIPKNTALLAMTGATLGKVGFLNFECTGNQSVAAFVNDKQSSKYIYYLLMYSQNEIKSYAGGAAQKGINKKSMQELTFNFPCLEEQTKIADFLSSIDCKRELAKSQLEQTQTFKKGLLQKMFV
jgi:type I restriction enzyme S subunit